jgi:hypothetical protein
MLIFCVITVIWRAMMVYGVLNGVFSIGPLVCEAHEVVDRPGLGSPQLFSEVPSNETIPKSINSSFG